jgi:hypothetical protein
MSWMSPWNPSVRGPNATLSKIDFGTGWAAGRRGRCACAPLPGRHPARRDRCPGNARRPQRDSRARGRSGGSGNGAACSCRSRTGPMSATIEPRGTGNETSATAGTPAIADGHAPEGSHRVLARIGPPALGLSHARMVKRRGALDRPDLGQVYVLVDACLREHVVCARSRRRRPQAGYRSPVNYPDRDRGSRYRNTMAARQELALRRRRDGRAGLLTARPPGGWLSPRAACRSPR